MACRTGSPLPALVTASQSRAFASSVLSGNRSWTSQAKGASGPLPSGFCRRRLKNVSSALRALPDRNCDYGYVLAASTRATFRPTRFRRLGLYLGIDFNWPSRSSAGNRRMAAI
jgi:hypothetical protein